MAISLDDGAEIIAQALTDNLAPLEDNGVPGDNRFLDNLGRLAQTLGIKGFWEAEPLESIKIVITALCRRNVAVDTNDAVCLIISAAFIGRMPSDLCAIDKQREASIKERFGSNEKFLDLLDDVIDDRKPRPN